MRAVSSWLYRDGTGTGPSNALRRGRIGRHGPRGRAWGGEGCRVVLDYAPTSARKSKTMAAISKVTAHQKIRRPANTSPEAGGRFPQAKSCTKGWVAQGNVLAAEGGGGGAAQGGSYGAVGDNDCRDKGRQPV